MMPHKQASLHVYRYSTSAHSLALTLANSAFDHGDDAIHKIQTHLYAKYHIGPRAAHLAKTNEYLQRLRIQKACELLESTKKTFDVIAYDVGYEDVSA